MNEQEQQQNELADLLITENALKVYSEKLKKQIGCIPYLKESKETKLTLKENLEATEKRTKILAKKTTEKILALC